MIDKKEEAGEYARVLKELREARGERVEQLIGEIRAREEFGIVPGLVTLLGEARDARLVSGLTSLLADVRDEQLIPLLALGIEMAKDDGDKVNLLRVCWESALDFSEYAELFARLLVEGDFAVALEASTVIENLGRVPGDRAGAIVKLLEGATTDEGRAPLVSAVVQRLSGR
ncbi:MAG: hypothetical protein LBI96_05645 [Odoribacteraceae bacterium]|jgi:hypothetical protein|nr:hypothetical protein [Odoribacteraceae bacterium]